MKKLSCFLSIFIIFLVCLFSVQETYACQCGPLPSVYETFNDADAVFIGKVVSSNEPKVVDDSYDGYNIIFDVEVIEKFKGPIGKKIKLNFGSKKFMCYAGYDVGDTYLIYLENNKLKTQKIIKEDDPIGHFAFCNHSGDIETTQDQIYFIREMLKGKPEPQIYGSVSLISDSYLEGIKVVIENTKNRFETLTDKNGIYIFNNIPEGDYVIKTVPEKKYKNFFSKVDEFTVWMPNYIEAKNYAGSLSGKAFYTTFLLDWNNQIKGRVVDSQGNSLERYVAKLLPLSAANDEIIPSVKGSPDQHNKGEFWFTGIMPGKYVLAVDIYAPFKNSIKKRFFYPQAETVKDAKIFEFNATTSIVDIEMKVPFTVRNINGEFVGTDGEPITFRGWVSLKKSESGDETANTSFDWGYAENGKFIFQAFDGFEYWIHTQVGKVKDNPQKVKIGKEDLQLRFEFDKAKILAEDSK